MIKTSNTTHWIDEEGIIHSLFDPQTSDTLETAKENIEADKQLAEGKQLPLLVDIRNLKSQSREAQNYYADEEALKVLSACAILIDSGLSKVIGNFFIAVKKPKLPTRLFTSESEALQWLRQFKGEQNGK
ncbi:MAG: STAS/SEC14 domain-containing protein [Leptospiraceae bacterium]|nr:STAS/SEC14 domain-containing protein [Leptospiraceae bacterium]MCP5493003.1 STAS/SEC14 domain-containing protein [Leptospiraceae bacterium]